MKFVSRDIIELERELSDLDLFTLDFIKVLRTYTPYVIVSGYVAIVLGRSRVSEDVDIIIPRLSYETFAELVKELEPLGFYCLNAESLNTMYDYLTDSVAIRFAKQNTAIPNIELKFAKNKVDEISLAKKVTIKLAGEELVVSALELQIAFKEVVLKSNKDIEDARHLRSVAQGNLDSGLLENYKRMLHDFY